jgi:hypothetical protein
VVDAVQCAVAVQKELQARNSDLPEDRKMRFRIGINLGDVIEEQERLYGDGVNIAARLEALADPGGICVSKTAFDQIETKLPLGYEYLGEQSVKNIPKPVGAYRVLMEPRVVVAGAKDKKPPVPLWRKKKVIAGAIAVLVVIICVVIWNFFVQPSPMEVASGVSSQKPVSSIATKNVTDENIGALEMELIEQNWGIMPVGTKVYSDGKEYSIRHDLANADLRLRVTNTSSNKILIADWVLLDRNKDYLAPFRFMEDDGKKYIKGKIFINGNKTRLIFLRSTSKSLKDQRDKEPLFLVDTTQTFIFPLNSIPDRAALLNYRQDKIKNCTPIDARDVIVGAFTVKVPSDWRSFSASESDKLRREYMAQREEIYRQYSGAPLPAKSVDIAAFHIGGDAGTFAIVSFTIPPQSDFVNLLKNQSEEKAKWGIQQGYIQKYLGLVPLDNKQFSGFYVKAIGTRGEVKISGGLEHKKLKSTLVQLTLFCPKAWDELKATNTLNSVLKSVKLRER